MIKGIVQAGEIIPLDPLPPVWLDGKQVSIEAADHAAAEANIDNPAEIQAWYTKLTALGPAQYEPGERETVDRLMADADRAAKQSMRQSWTQSDDALSARHESPQQIA